MRGYKKISLKKEITPKSILREEKKDIDCDKFAKSLSEILPEKLIAEALNKSSSFNSQDKKKFRFNLFLEKIEKNSIYNYLEEKNSKNKILEENAFMKNINEFKKSVNLLMESNKKEIKEYKEKYNKVNEENKLLNQKIYLLNKAYQELQIEINNNNKIYVETKQLLTKFDKHKKLFNGLISEYPGKDPIEIIQEMKKTQNNLRTLFEENQSLKDKMVIMEKDNSEIEEKHKKIMADLNEKIILLQKTNKSSVENYEKQLFFLRQEIKNLYDLKEKNNNLHKMLFNIYNKIIDMIKIDKEININEKYLGIEEKDFKLTILDEEEIYNYIAIMISHLRGNMDNKLITEVIAFSNMIIRRYCKNNVSLRFDPINTFKKIKDIFGEHEKKINQLREKIENNEKDIKYLTKQNEAYRKLLIKSGRDRIVLINNNNNNDIRNQNMKKLNNSTSPIHISKNIIRNSASLSNELIISPDNSKHCKTIENKYNNVQNTKKLSLRDSSKTRKALSSSLIVRKKKGRLNIDNSMEKKNQLKNRSIYLNDKKSVKERINSYNINLKRKLLNKTSRENMNISKRFRIRHNQNNSLCIYEKELKSLINHTNNLFMYEFKTKSFSQMKNKDILSEPLKKKIASMKEMNKYNNEYPQNNIKKRIVDNINKLILNLDKEQKKE